MTWHVLLTPSAARSLRKLDPPSRRRIQAVLELLADDPRPPTAIQLVGGNGKWRVRTGDFRVIYLIQDAEILVLVLVLALGHRREVYRGQ